MAEQGLIGRLGIRLGILGSSASLAIAAPLASGNYDPTCHTDAARIGWYFDRTAGAEKIGMIVGGVTGPLYTRSGTSVNMTMNTPNPNVVIGDGTVSGTLSMNGAAGNNRFIKYQSGGLDRWAIGLNNTAESGANAGSDFVINAYTDAGAFIDTPLQITRAAFGIFTVNRPITIASGTLTTLINTFNSTVTWNNAAIAFTAWNLNVTDTASSASANLLLLNVGGVARLTLGKTGRFTNNSVDDLTAAQVLLARAFTLTGNVTDTMQVTMSAVLSGAFTITRYNYIQLQNITGAATVSNGCVFRFNAAAGTHKAVDAGTTKVTVTGVDAWMKQNINGTIFYQPLYLSKTA
jgi:hypothetical protein